MPIECLLLALAVLCIALARAIEDSSLSRPARRERDESAPAPAQRTPLDDRDRSTRERGG